MLGRTHRGKVKLMIQQVVVSVLSADAEVSGIGARAEGDYLFRLFR